MSDGRAQDHISKKRTVYRIDGMEEAVVRKDVVYHTTDGGRLTMDIYYPPGAVPDVEATRPAVVFAAGYGGAGSEKVFGVPFKEMGMIVSWAQLVAASGQIAIAYSNRDPAPDLDALLDYLFVNGATLGVDGSRIGVWAASGNVPVALGALIGARRQRLRCAALLYGFMLDLDGATGVAAAAQAYRFTNPNAGATLDDLRPDLPLLIVRAGQEQFAHLNASIDAFFTKALTLNRPITLVNHAAGQHAFDLVDDSEASRAIIRQVLGFLAAHLS